MKNTRLKMRLLTGAVLCALPCYAMAADPVAYEADSAVYNQFRQIATLSGNVKLTQGDKTVAADEVRYDRMNDVVVASGNVTITDKDGSVHHAKKVTLTDGMKQGLADQLFSTMPDGGRVRADTAERKSQNAFVLNRAHYTACAPCERDPDGTRPAWEITADHVDFDNEHKQATYHNAWFDFYGVPMLYTPWFRHSTEKVKQKSGLLAPRFGWNSTLGGFVEQQYYYAISPSKDATVGVLASTSRAPVLTGEYRQRFDNADLKMKGSVTRSNYKQDKGTTSAVSTNDKWRGHFFADARWDVSNTWRTGAQLQLASDPQYLKQYRFQAPDVLVNRVYAERFSGRNYTGATIEMYQDLRTGTSKVDQPGVLPHITTSFLGEPGKTFGGRWSLTGDALSLFREGNGQDVYRLSGTLGWERQDVLPLGFLLVDNLSVRGDVYEAHDRDAASIDPTKSNNNHNGRVFPTAQATLSYPLRKPLAHGSLRVAPEISITAVPNLNNNSSIPNEDSQDAQIDTGNLFDANRFPGLDRVEDKSHVAYGVRTGYYGDNGNTVRVFVGQSARIGSNSDNPFGVSSGLDTSKSDYVGEISTLWHDGAYAVNYKTQVDSKTKRSERQEVYAAVRLTDRLTVDGTYMYARGSGTTPTNEQAVVDATIKLTDAWAFNGGVNYNLAKPDKGLRRVTTGFNYTHECYAMGINVEREVAKETSGADQLTVMMRFALKNLGEFTTTTGN